MMKGRSGTTQVANKLFQANGTDTQASTGIRDIVNANLDVQITASLSSNVITLTSLAPGPDGNKNLTLVSVPSTVTISGTTAQSSGSGLGLTGG